MITCQDQRQKPTEETGCRDHHSARVMKTSFVQLFLIFWLNVFGVRSEVDQGFSHCLQYFYKSAPPRLTRSFADPPKGICQRYDNAYRYATLYSTSLRIPVYSAYTLPEPCTGSPGAERRSRWFVEPQVCNLFDLLNYEVNKLLINEALF